MSITIDAGHEVTLYSPVCTYCKHATGFRSCEAFGEKGIPLPIWDGENDHTEPYPGDNGIRFERTYTVPGGVLKRAKELPDERTRTNLDLRALRADLEELAEDVLPRFEDLSEAEQDAWLYEWPDKRARVEELEAFYRDRDMSAEQRADYEDLRSRLREMAPAMNEAGLRVPPELLDD